MKSGGPGTVRGGVAGGVGGPGGGMLPNTSAVQPEGSADAGLLAALGLLFTAAATRLTTKRLPVRRR